MHQKFATEFKRMMTFHFPLNTFLTRKCSFPRRGKGRGVPLPNQQLNECIAVTLTQTQNAQGGSKKRMHVSKQGSRIWGRVIELYRVCWPKISLALTHLFIHTNVQGGSFLYFILNHSDFYDISTARWHVLWRTLHVWRSFRNPKVWSVCLFKLFFKHNS